MARSGCCGGVTCGCVLTGGTGVTIAGSGTPDDPFEIGANVNLEVIDNADFNLTRSGVGSPADPYRLEVTFAATSSVRSLGDVSDDLPGNGQVLVWSSANQRYEPGPQTTAPVGAVSHDNSLAGDGSAGDVLEVRHSPTGGLVTTADGIGLADVTRNRLVRRFPDSATRAATAPAPDLNTFSTLDTAPGRLDYWDGVRWRPVDVPPRLIGTTFLELSGPYPDGARVERIVKHLSTTTDASGVFTALSSADLAGLGGVLDVRLQPVGSVMFNALLAPGPGYVGGTAYRPDTGVPYPTQPVEALVEATVYR